MKPNIKLNKARDLEEIIDDSILFFKQNFKPLLKSYFTICGFFIVTAVILYGFYQVYSGAEYTSSNNNFVPSFYLIAMFEGLIQLLTCLISLSYIATYIVKENQAPSIVDVWIYVKFYFVRMLVSGILLILGLCISSVFFLFPSVYLWPIFCLIPVIMIMENTSLSNAFNQAFQLIKTNWGNLFGILIISFLLMFATAILLSIPITIITTIIVFLVGKSEVNISMMGLNIGLHLVQFLFIFPYITTTLFYFNLIEKRGNKSLFSRIQMVGKQKQLSTQEEEF